MAADTGLTKTQATACLDSMMTAIRKALKKGDKVTLVGFGTYSVSKRAARTGRNHKLVKQSKLLLKMWYVSKQVKNYLKLFNKTFLNEENIRSCGCFFLPKTVRF
jgi:DNA-binding protein HU-beta